MKLLERIHRFRMQFRIARIRNLFVALPHFEQEYTLRLLMKEQAIRQRAKE